MVEFITNMDWAILYWIRDTFTCPALDYIMPKITSLGDKGFIWILTAFVLQCTKENRKYGITLIAGLLAGVLFGNVFLKNLIERSRPNWIDQTITLLIANPTDFSFPSGHTLSSAIAATILTMSNKKFGYIAIPLACLIAFSRLYLFVHFPSDVLAAALIGSLIGALVFIGIKRISKNIKE
ncbi:phosphatase PAP2 family protein [Lacrimispora aerotolerans]|uniref:phosphatase PAP2 family protein n=1 Tax=Lacrimispora aerotolerans TaxID=36832 RepID=UPI00047E5247|nr:phosphatase PAP2 family protein [Lacrimispora aerotolerans]